MSRNILFMANNNLGEGLSGGDRIFSELIRQQWDWRVRAGDIHRAVFGDSA